MRVVCVVVMRAVMSLTATGAAAIVRVRSMQRISPHDCEAVPRKSQYRRKSPDSVHRLRSPDIEASRPARVVAIRLRLRIDEIENE